MTDTKGNDEPKSKTAGEGTGKVDTSKKRSKTGEGNEEEEKTGEKNTSKKRKKAEEGNEDESKNDKNKKTDEPGTDGKGGRNKRESKIGMAKNND